MATKMSAEKLAAAYDAKQVQAYDKLRDAADKIRAATGLGPVQKRIQARFLSAFDKAEMSNAHAAGTFDWLGLLLKLLPLILMLLGL